MVEIKRMFKLRNKFPLTENPDNREYLLMRRLVKPSNKIGTDLISRKMQEILLKPNHLNKQYQQFSTFMTTGKGPTIHGN